MSEHAWTVRDRLTGLALAALAAAAFWPSLAAGFNADDYLILHRIRSLDGLADPLAYFRFGFYDYFRPLAFLTHAVDYALWGVNAFGFHLTNLALHAAATWLVFAIARRFMATGAAAVAAILFATHAASHEAVYWVAARFDLLATSLTLAALAALTRDGRTWRALGLAAFALALLSKESAIALLVIAPAWDVWIARHDWKTVARRLTPLLAVTAAYAVVRLLVAGVGVAGGSGRLPKLILVGVSMMAVVAWAWWRDHRPAGGLAVPTRGGTTGHARAAPGATAPLSVRRLAMLAAAALAGTAALLLTPATFPWAAEKVGFVVHVIYFSLSPIVLPVPDPARLLPESIESALALAALAVAVLAAIGTGLARSAIPRAHLGFFLACIGAALLPVLSMTGGLRYLYLPAAGLSWLAAAWIDRLTTPWRRAAHGAAVLYVALSLVQIWYAGRVWRAGAELTREGIERMAARLEPCGTKDVVLLTAPVGTGGVYTNFSWDAFDVLTGCAPRSFTIVLRVVRFDVGVRVSQSRSVPLELRIPDYRGQIVASVDLRRFDRPIASGAHDAFDTPVGRIETYPEGDAQVFRIDLTADARRALTYYYAGGRIRSLEPLSADGRQSPSGSLQ